MENPLICEYDIWKKKKPFDMDALFQYNRKKL